MRIVFTRDYRGVHTGEVRYRAGEVADLARGAEIVAEGAATPAPEPEPEAPPEPKAQTDAPEPAPASRPRGRKAP